MIALARIVRPHGVRGAVKALLLADEPAALREGEACCLLDPAGGARRSCRIEAIRRVGRAAVLTLEGVGSMEEAGAMVGWLLAIPEERLGPLPAGTFYAEQLAGARVLTEDGVEVGEFAGVEPHPGHDLWIVRAAGREHLVPAVGEIVRRVDLAAREIRIRPPEGLLEL